MPQFKAELSSELENILQYWKDFSVDEEHGGFVGQRDHENRLVKKASKGVILNTRLLWTFSAAANFKAEKEGELRKLADRAYEYLKKHFQDKIHGGVFWELNAEGIPINRRKQVYAQAFAIYALSEYYLLTGVENAKKWALSLFDLLEQHALDSRENGYFEAFQEDWSPIEDMRLSEKDRNASKTMNTHLHVLEAYTTLAKISEDDRVTKALENLVELFLDKFYDPRNQHFQLFFDDHWQREGNVISFGHDIEAVWLIIEAAKATGNSDFLKRAEDNAVPVAETFLKEAYVPQKGVINEKDFDSGKTDLDRHWWPQIEAMVGLEYAYAISENEDFRSAITDIWNFTKKHIIDHKNGEWYFRINENNRPYPQEDKLGMWKCPYHNSRGCMVFLKRTT